MLKFDKEWTDEIVEESTRPEYQNATIRIVMPAVDEEYDIETGEWTGGEPELVYEGQARIIGVRWGVFFSGQTLANSRTVKAIRFQIPYKGTERVRRTAAVTVLDAPRNPSLTTLSFAITSDFQGAAAAARTFEASLDGDSEA